MAPEGGVIGVSTLRVNEAQKVQEPLHCRPHMLNLQAIRRHCFGVETGRRERAARRGFSLG
jgi:hypothetical protein